MASHRSATRVGIVRLLKQNGELTVQAIAEARGITPVAVRKHLGALKAERMVEARRVKLPRGRPTFSYQVTVAADALLPRGYDRLAIDLLEDLAALDGEASLRRLFLARNERLSRDYESRLADKDLPDRFRELARLRDEEGYMAVFEIRDGSFVLREHHCPIYEVAQRHPEACSCEQELFQKVLDKRVRRETRLVDGESCCEYRIGA